MKHVIMAAALAATALLSACNDGTPKANLKTDLDTLSYEMGLASSANFESVMYGQFGVDSAYVDEFLKGVRDGALTADDKKKAAYYAGIQIGQQISQQMVRGTEMQIFGDDSTKHLSVKNVVAGFISGVKGKTAVKVDGKVLTPQMAFESATTRMDSIRAKTMEQKYGANKEAGEKFLAENAKKPGIKTLQGGVQYKVITEGSGEIPSDTSLVLVRYEGRLITDSICDSTDKNNGGKPVEMMPVRSIKGFAAALTHMPIGSTWEVYIPAYMAYGDREAGDIPPYSTLIFKITLDGFAK